MKHKHAELIKAWADGEVIEQRFTDRNFNYNNWESVKNPIWHDCGCEYRIKPEPKPDLVKHIHFDADSYEGKLFITDILEAKHSHWDLHIKVVIDGETGKLKSAEVIQ